MSETGETHCQARPEAARAGPVTAHTPNGSLNSHISPVVNVPGSPQSTGAGQEIIQIQTIIESDTERLGSH